MSSKKHEFLDEISSYKRNAIPITEKKNRVGYIYAIGEINNNAVFIQWAGDEPVRDIVKKMQVGNYRRLSLLCVLYRANIDNAKLIYDTITAGLILDHISGGWYSIEHDRIKKMLASIDRLN